MDPPNVFIDAVDGLLHCAVTAPNGSYDRHCWCLALIWHPILSWQLPAGAHAVYPNRWWTLQMYWKMQLTGCSRAPWQLWMVQMTHLDVVMKSHSQLTIANLGAGCPPPLDDGSFKCLQRCSWWAITGRHDGYEWFNWHTLTLSCPNMTSYLQVTIANSYACCLPPKDDGSFKCIQRCSGRAVPGCFGGTEWFK